MSIPVDAENRRVDASVGEPRPPLEAAVESPADLTALRRRWERLTAVPVLAEHRGQGTDHSWAGLDVRTLLAGEQSAGRFSAHSIVLAPGAGLPAHYHLDTYTYLLVTDGEAELRVGDTVQPAGRHSLGFVPPRTRQGYRNTSDSPVTLTVIHSPAGPERAFADAHAHRDRTGDEDESAYRPILARHGIRFDDTPLENDARTDDTLPPVEFEVTGHGDLARLREAFTRRPALPRLVRPTTDEREVQQTGVTRREPLLTGDDSGGQGMLNLLTGVPGFGAPDHHQPTEEEFFLITGGQLWMRCGTRTADLRAGAFAFCPRNCTHAFRNPTDTTTQFITLNSPAGHERAMAAVRRLSGQGATKEALHDLAVAGGFVFHSVEDLG